jgi:hypothetical protein
MPGHSDCLCAESPKPYTSAKNASDGARAQNPTQVKMQGLGYLAQYFTIAANDFGSSDAPPTSAPSISSCAISADALSGLTDPP